SAAPSRLRGMLSGAGGVDRGASARPSTGPIGGRGFSEHPGQRAHAFRNTADAAARLLCTVAPAGLESFFAEFGDPVPTRTSPAPELSDAERQIDYSARRRRPRNTA